VRWITQDLIIYILLTFIQRSRVIS